MHLKRAASVSFMLSVLYPLTAFAAPVRPAQLADWDALRLQVGVPAEIGWDQQAGTPAYLSFNRPMTPQRSIATPASVSTSRVGAEAFFRDHAGLFRLRPGVDELAFESTTERGGLRYLTYRQRYQGVEVSGRGYTVTLDPGGQILHLSGSLLPDIDSPAAAATSPQDAEQAALRALTNKREQVVQPAQLVIVQEADRARLFYLVRMNVREGFQPLAVYVDATDGTVVDVRDLLMHAPHPPAIDPIPAPSSGRKAPPVQRPAVRPSILIKQFDDGGDGGPTGGSGPCDCGRAYLTTPCDGGLTGVSLPRLTDHHYMNGTLVNVVSAVSTLQAIDPTYNGNFVFSSDPPNLVTTPDTTPTDDVNLYYHVDRMLSGFFAARFSRSLPAVLTVNSHLPYPKPDGTVAAHVGDSAYNPETRQLQFGDGSYGNTLAGNPGVLDPAKLMSVIAHETSHAILHASGLYATNDVSAASFEARSIQEGMADYFAADYAQTPRLMTCMMYPTTTFPDCSTQPMRDLASDPYYSNVGYTYGNFSIETCDHVRSYRNDDPHIFGLVMGMALWEIKTATTDDVVGNLVFDALPSLGSVNNSMLAVRGAMLFADQNRYGGAHLCQIESAFFHRGVGGQPNTAQAFSLFATPINCGVHLAWTPSLRASRFKVYRDGTYLRDVAAVPAQTANYQTDDYPAPGGQHLYRVDALNCQDFTTPATAFAAPIPVLVAPNAPTVAAGTATQHCDLLVSWNAVSGANGYLVYKDGQTSPVDRGVPNLPDPGAAGAVHSYVVTAYQNVSGGRCESAPSAPGSWSTPPAPTSAPAGLIASDDHANQVDLTWNALAGVDGYHVYRKPKSGGAFARIGSSTTTGYSDTPVPNGVFVYEVAGFICTNDGPMSLPDDGHKLPPPLVAAISGPTTLAANVTGTWTVTTDQLSGVTYHFEWSRYRDCPVPPPPPTPAPSGASPAGSLSVVNLPCYYWYPFGADSPSGSMFDVYDFRIQCSVSDDLGRSVVLQRNVDIPGVAGSPLDPPASLAASDGTGSAIVLTWTGVLGAEGYRLYRDGAQIASLTPSAVTFTDASPSLAMHTYCLSAYSGSIVSGLICDTGYPATANPAVSVSGPTALGSNSVGYFTATAQGGLPPLSYVWEKYRDCPPVAAAAGASTAQEVTCWAWFVQSSTTPSYSASDHVDFQVSATVTDALGRVATDVHCIDVAGSLGRDQCGNAGRGPRLSPAAAQPVVVDAPILETGVQRLFGTGGGDGIRVEFSLRHDAAVSLALYDIAGRQVAMLMNGSVSAGRYSRDLSAPGLRSGLYLYRFRADDRQQQGRLLILH